MKTDGYKEIQVEGSNITLNSISPLELFDINTKDIKTDADLDLYLADNKINKFKLRKYKVKNKRGKERYASRYKSDLIADISKYQLVKEKFNSTTQFLLNILLSVSILVAIVVLIYTTIRHGITTTGIKISLSSIYIPWIFIQFITYHILIIDKLFYYFVYVSPNWAIKWFENKVIKEQKIGVSSE